MLIPFGGKRNVSKDVYLTSRTARDLFPPYKKFHMVATTTDSISGDLDVEKGHI